MMDSLDGLTYEEQVEYYRRMDDNTMHALILHYEGKVDGLLAEGKLTQEDAWDCYFEMMNECDTRGFLGDFDRIRAKIDTARYNPLNSANPQIIQIVRYRAKMHGLIPE